MKSRRDSILEGSKAAARLHDELEMRRQVEAQAGLQRDSEQSMFVDLRKIHFFEPGETGMNLSLKSEPAHALA